jgi:hypothetical protein
VQHPAHGLFAAPQGFGQLWDLGAGEEPGAQAVLLLLGPTGAASGRFAGGSPQRRG